MWNKVKELFANGSQALLLAGAFNAGLFCICLSLYYLDARVVAGLNPWVKPMKFCLSITAYAFTLAVILGLIDGFEKMRLWIGRAVAVLMYIEIACVTLQAARGVPSHYNIDTSYDAALFALMGVAIGLNTVIDSVVFGLMVLSPLEDVPVGVLWGIRLGLAMFVGAGFEGSFMIMNQAHTVGAADGVGKSLPWVNWNREHGDLRVAHYIGLHSLQILPALGLVLDWILKSAAIRAAIVTLAAAGLGWLMWSQTQLALAGKTGFPL